MVRVELSTISVCTVFECSLYSDDPGDMDKWGNTCVLCSGVVSLFTDVSETR